MSGRVWICCMCSTTGQSAGDDRLPRGWEWHAGVPHESPPVCGHCVADVLEDVLVELRRWSSDSAQR